MSRYIKDTDVYKLVEPNGMAMVHCSQIDELPRVDVVEVVRCKDCVHHDDCICVVCEEENTVVCMKMSMHFPKDHFCSYGERREK